MLILPHDFPLDYQFNGFKIKYECLMEVNQGGPEIGKLVVNHYPLDGYYSGPLLIKGEYIYAPIVQKSFWGGTRFKIAQISLENRRIRYVSDLKKVILLNKFVDNNLFYYTDLKNTQQEIIQIP